MQRTQPLKKKNLNRYVTGDLANFHYELDNEADYKDAGIDMIMILNYQKN